MSIAFPFFYYVLSILLGLYVTGWFPYWFMNPLRTSWTMIVVWFVVLLLVFLCFDWIFITLSRKMEKRKNPAVVSLVWRVWFNKALLQFTGC